MSDHFQGTTPTWLAGPLLLVMLLAACSARAEPGVPSSMPDATQPGRPTLSNTPVITPTRPVEPTVAPTRQVVPTMASPTAGATIPPEERLRKYYDLLRSNGGCQLPCWWGIAQGQTPWSLTEPFFNELGTRAYPSESPCTEGLTCYDIATFDNLAGDYGLYPVIGTEGEVVRTIVVSVQRQPIAGRASTFVSDWQFYTLTSTLKAYGAPSRVQVWVDLTAECGTGHACSENEVWIFYDALGVVAHYDWVGALWSSKSKPIPLCPTTDPLLYIDLYLQSPADATLLENLVTAYDKRYPRSADSGETLHSLQESTGWDIDRFYRTYIEDNTRTCMDTPASLWPSR